MIAHRGICTTGSIAGFATLAIVLSSCKANDDSACVGLSAADTVRIEAEVRQALDDYGASNVAGDWERVDSFWGDFDDFIHAGDGRVFGDRNAWISWMHANRSNNAVSWEYSDVHVAVLGANAASYTANFEVVNMVDGEESTITGSWTWVLRKTEDGWRVVHSNGKHNGFSYYDEPE